MLDTERAIYKVFIRGSIDAVWSEITKTESIQQCMFNMRLHTPGLKVGAPIQMRTKSGKHTGVIGEVLEFDPPHRYSHTFQFTNFDDQPCVVTYDLKEVTGGVEFLLTIDRLPNGTRTAKQMKQGGTLIVNALKAIVERGRPPFGTRLLYKLFRIMEPFSPRRTRSENWPLGG
ncbi:hypothetical protein BH11PLA2_BH11PLA2_06000 [soil metagenome]